MDKRMKTVQCRSKGYHDKPIHNASKNIEVGKYVYLNRPPITRSTVERLTNGSYSKLLSVKTGRFLIIELSPTTVTMAKVKCAKLYLLTGIQ